MNPYDTMEYRSNERGGKAAAGHSSCRTFWGALRHDAAEFTLRNSVEKKQQAIPSCAVQAWCHDNCEPLHHCFLHLFILEILMSCAEVSWFSLRNEKESERVRKSHRGFRRSISHRGSKRRAPCGPKPDVPKPRCGTGNAGNAGNAGSCKWSCKWSYF